MTKIPTPTQAPEMREPSSGGGFWKTFVNPYPSGWILEPQPEVGDDLRQRRSQVFDTNWFVTQNDFKTCNESFTYFDEDTEEMKLKHGAEQYCLGKIALPWRGEPFIRGSRNEHQGVKWEKAPSWRDLNYKGLAPSPRYRHAASSIGPYLIIFGGYGPDVNTPLHPQVLLNDLHVFDVRSMQWLDVVTEGKFRPSPRTYFSNHSHSLKSSTNSIFKLHICIHTVALYL